MRESIFREMGNDNTLAPLIVNFSRSPSLGLERKFE